MPKTQNFIFGESITVPLSAIAIEVTNIHDPFNIRARETENFREKLHIINKKLLIVHRTNLGNNVSTADPKAGNEVIICHNLSKDIDIPAWLCRGLICSADPVRKRYNILLVDYGNCIELNRADFVVSSSDLICEEHLSFTLALSNILPVCGNNNSSKEEKVVFQIIKKWSAPAIQFTKELLAVSSAVYFDCLALDDCGRKYGELYLDIEQNIIRLRDALVANGYGMYLEEELLKSLAKIMSCGKANMKIVNDETVFCAMVPRYNKAAVEETKRGTNMQSLENGGCMNDQAKNDRHKILIYGPVKCEYLFSVLDAKFPATIHKAWNSVIQSSRPTRIQSCMWPAIKKGLDVVVIGTPKSGKTIGYTMAVCGHLASHSTLPQAAKPSAVILCSSSTDVFKVYSLCTGFLESHAQIKCVAAHHGKSDRSVAAEIFNGCQILISTPKFLVRFLNQNGKLVEFTHLRYLVLDQADVILDKYLDSVGQLFEQHVIRSSDMRATDLTLQVILTARHCTPLLKKHMFVWTNNPYICIASFIEAVIFKSIRPKMYVSNLVDKNKVILEFLSNAYTKLRTMIVCASTPEAEELNEFLSVCKKTLLAHGSMNLVTLKDIKRCWQACVTGFYPVFICTDEVLSDMGVTNVEWLIHYSISLDLRTQFNFRFFTLLDNLRMEKSTCKVTIMADENNDVQFQSIIKIMQRMNVVISDNMLKSIERISITLDKKKKDYPICNNVKSFGFCSQKATCFFRHCIIPDVDSPMTNIEINDKVKLMVICVHDAGHVSARVISYLKFDTQEEIQFSSMEYMRSSVKIQEYYANVENRRRCEAVNVGDVCGLEESTDSYKRVQILYIEKGKSSLNQSSYANVRCIDSGFILANVNIYKLLFIPEELAKLPTQVVEVFLTGIAPHDEEYVWSPPAVNAVHDWFKEHIDERSYVIGTVNLHLGNTMWVNTLEIGTRLIGYTDLIGSSLKMDLLKKGHAIENPKHMSNVYKLCSDAGLTKINGHCLNTLINECT